MGRWIAKLALGVNFVVGLLVCAFYLTDYSWTSVPLNLAFPGVGLVLGASVFVVVIASSDTGMLERLACIPSAAGGLASLVLLPLSILHLTFAAIGEVRQEAFSPDNHRVARLNVKLLGAWGDDQAYINVVDRRAPFLLRVVKHEVSWETDRLAWTDGDHLALYPGGEALEVGVVGPAMELIRGPRGLEEILLVTLAGAGIGLAALFLPARLRRTRER